MEVPPAAEALRLEVRRWARGLPEEVLAESAHRGVLPEAVVRELLALGVQRAPFPRRAGGLGLGQAGFTAALAELAAVDGSLAATVMATVSCATLLHLFGTPGQRGRWLRPLLAGEGLGAIALTEPGSGSDLGAVTARAEPAANGGWLLHGRKVFITNALSPLLHVIVTLAREDPGPGPGCFVLSADLAGVRRSGPLGTVGWSGAGVGEIAFEGCALRRTQLVGTAGRGLAQVLRALAYGRVAVAAIAAGTAQGAFERTLGHARRRTSAGSPLAEHEAVRQLLVDLWLRAEQARLWAAHAAAAADQGGDLRTVAAMAKLQATGCAMENAAAAVRLHGAHGARARGPVARLWGDAKVLEIVEGASEIQRLILGRALSAVSPDPGAV